MSEKQVVEKETKIDTSKMNLFTKIQNVRVELQKRNIAKSGKNKFSGFEYFELSDFLPHINDLCLKYGLFTFEDINSTIATITAVDCDNPDVVFALSIPTAEVELKGANKIQEIGSLLTYSRRYLYLSLFAISDGDVLDATLNKDEDKPVKDKKPTKTTEKVEEDNKTKLKKLCTELSSKGHREEVQKLLMEKANVKNPNSISDEKIITDILTELQKIEA